MGSAGSGGVHRAERGAIEVGGRRVVYDARGPAGGDSLIFHPGRTVADCAREVVAIAGELGIERFYTADEGHLSLAVDRCGDVLDDLIAAAG